MLLLALVAAAVIAGCGWDSREEEHEGSRPSVETLKKLFEASRYNPVYWLGDEFEGLEISGAAIEGIGAWVSYGKRSCDVGSGCSSFPIKIYSSPGWPNPYLPPTKRRYTCFKDIRGATLLEDCRNAKHPAGQFATLITGPSPADAKSGFGNPNFVRLGIAGAIGSDSGVNAADIARQIVPINSPTQIPHRILRPDPVPCPRLEYLVRWWVEANVEQFGPNPQCDVSELLGVD